MLKVGSYVRAVNVISSCFFMVRSCVEEKVVENGGELALAVPWKLIAGFL
jgi:hypothetical protein